eukprot:6186727-Amphidinium_carterae.1
MSYKDPLLSSGRSVIVNLGMHNNGVPACQECHLARAACLKALKGNEEALQSLLRSGLELEEIAKKRSPLYRAHMNRKHF